MEFLTSPNRKVDIFSINRGNPIASTAFGEDILPMLYLRSKGQTFLAFFSCCLIDVVSSQINLRVVCSLIIDEPVWRTVVPLALILTVAAAPLELVICVVMVVLTTGVPSPLQHLHPTNYLYQVCTRNTRDRIRYYVACFCLAVGVDQLTVMLHSRGLTCDINILADLWGELEAPTVDGSPFLVEPGADKGAEEEEGA